MPRGINRPDKWIQDAKLKKGAFTRQAKAHGKSVQAYAKIVLKPANKEKTTETTKRRARLAQTFAKMGRKRKPPVRVRQTRKVRGYLD